MAEKLEGAGGKQARTKKNKSNGGIGHNLTEIRKNAEPIFKRYEALKKENESVNAEFAADCKDLWETGADKLGIGRAVLSREVKRMWRNKKEAEAEAEMDSVEREQTEQLRAALEGTPFGAYVEGKLAKAATPEKPEKAKE